MRKIYLILFLTFVFSSHCIAQEIASQKELIVRFTEEADIQGTKTGFSYFDSLMEKYAVSDVKPILLSQDYYIYKLICEKKIN